MAAFDAGKKDTWYSSHHVPVWIAFDVSVPGLEVNFDSLGVHLETLPRASQGIRDPAAPPLRGVVPECPPQGRPRNLSHPRRRAYEDPTGSREKHTRKVPRTTRQRARVGHSLGVALIAGVSQHRQ